MFVVVLRRECFAKAGAKRKAGVQGLTRQAQTHRALYHATVAGWGSAKWRISKTNTIARRRVTIIVRQCAHLCSDQ